MVVRRSVISGFSYLSSSGVCCQLPLCSPFSNRTDSRRNIFAARCCGTNEFTNRANIEKDGFHSILSSLPGRLFSTTSAGADAQSDVVRASDSRIFSLMRHYEDIIGLTDVKEAQRKVLMAERDFERMQELRRSKHDEIRQLQSQLKDVHGELDKTSRGEDRYLNLLTREHGLIKQERSLVDEFKRVERSERECFNTLSTRLRESHEKERERAERTKYWSIIGSAIGALMGILGATISNRLRIRELRNVVEQNSDPGRIQTVIGHLSDTIHSQQQQVAAFVDDLRAMLGNTSAHWNSALMTNLAHRTGGVVGASPKDLDRWISPEQSTEIMATIKEQEKKMEGDMQEIKKLIAAEHGYSMKQDGTIVYVGPEMQALLEQTERNIDTKLKINTLVAVVAIYGALALTLPLLYALFRSP